MKSRLQQQILFELLLILITQEHIENWVQTAVQESQAVHLALTPLILLCTYVIKQVDMTRKQAY